MADNLAGRLVVDLTDAELEQAAQEAFGEAARLAILTAHAIDGVIPDTTAITHPDHHTVGKEFGGHDLQDKTWPGKRWFCFSHDRMGYWMFATDGSGHWTNVSERAIGRAFHEIYHHDGRAICPWFRRGVPPYVVRQGCHGCTARADWAKRPCDRTDCPLRQEFES